MGKRKEIEEAPELEPTVTDATDAAPAKPVKGEIVVKYRDHTGIETSRTFSKEMHGDDFAKFANEFIETNKSRIIGAQS